jgi:hypothetical protein
MLFRKLLLCSILSVSSLAPSWARETGEPFFQPKINKDFCRSYVANINNEAKKLFETFNSFSEMLELRFRNLKKLSPEHEKSENFDNENDFISKLNYLSKCLQFKPSETRALEKQLIWKNFLLNFYKYYQTGILQFDNDLIKKEKDFLSAFDEIKKFYKRDLEISTFNQIGEFNLTPYFATFYPNEKISDELSLVGLIFQYYQQIIPIKKFFQKRMDAEVKTLSVRLAKIKKTFPKSYKKLSEQLTTKSLESIYNSFYTDFLEEDSPKQGSFNTSPSKEDSNKIEKKKQENVNTLLIEQTPRKKKKKPKKKSNQEKLIEPRVETNHDSSSDSIEIQDFLLSSPKNENALEVVNSSLIPVENKSEEETTETILTTIENSNNQVLLLSAEESFPLTSTINLENGDSNELKNLEKQEIILKTPSLLTNELLITPDHVKKQFEQVSACITVDPALLFPKQSKWQNYFLKLTSDHIKKLNFNTLIDMLTFLTKEFPKSGINFHLGENKIVANFPHKNTKGHTLFIRALTIHMHGKKAQEDKNIKRDILDFFQQFYELFIYEK